MLEHYENKPEPVRDTERDFLRSRALANLNRIKGTKGVPDTAKKLASEAF